MAESPNQPAGSPFDTPASSALRFAVELVAWVAGPWAVASLTDRGWAAIPALLVLVGLPSLFNTPGDKRVDGIPTPGPLRIVIEAFLAGVALWAAWSIWPTWAAVVTTVVVLGMVATGWKRYQWLAAGAPEPGDMAS